MAVHSKFVRCVLFIVNLFPCLVNNANWKDRYAGLSGPGSFRGGLRGGPRGGFRGGLRGGFRGGARGGLSGNGEGRAFNSEIYADYSGPDQQSAGAGGGGSAYSGGFGGGNGFGPSFDAEPSQQIMVRNVSRF